MNADRLGSIAGIALSLLFSYAPGLNARYDAKDPTIKRLIMGALLLLSAGIIYGLSCGGVISGYVECTQAGLTSFVGIFIDALIANQGMYLVSPRKAA